MSKTDAGNSASALEICMGLARATVQGPIAPGGAPLATILGPHFAETVIRELGEKLANVMPAAVVDTIGRDVLRGGEEISNFLYGTPESATLVYQLAREGRIPVFKIGRATCARKSTLLRWIEDQEQRKVG
ncbi:helix-turn-helix domain-containing protein [Azospirillum rugosum]|uniref:Helix-turn-helix domain-containing protein n=1 Tax=Azospirillum rugosum TaxID=416170 RepID=A0ABS4SQ80_9PROT|nr:helix-turn-helix domain-containing protein [Azospirillum rugosum]MBP2294716.1 hypothetical protein [Azospirillum rugosum]MDQ0527995.1 hypothetical protein [Azospirillum rugosum]